MALFCNKLIIFKENIIDAEFLHKQINLLQDIFC